MPPPPKKKEEKKGESIMTSPFKNGGFRKEWLPYQLVQPLSVFNIECFKCIFFNTITLETLNIENRQKQPGDS